MLRATAEIPYGQTASYRDVATRAGSPSAVRAAGTALATNPLPIVVPCHRVLRTGGGLGGYARRPRGQGRAAPSGGRGVSRVWDVYESPLGPLTLTASERGLTGSVPWPRGSCRARALGRPGSPC